MHPEVYSDGISAASIPKSTSILSQTRERFVRCPDRKPLSVIKNPFSFGSNGPMGLGNKTMSTIGSSNGGQIHFQASTSTRIPESEKSSN